MALSDLRPSEVITEEGGQYNFTGDRPPTGPTAKQDMDITRVGDDLNPYDLDGEGGPQQGRDTYTGIPGDGIVPG